MTLLTRSTLKNLFTRGSVPSEVHFSDLIDSTINKVDDGFSQSQEHGFMLSPQGSNKKLLSFFEKIGDPKAAFSLSLNPNRHSKGLSIDDEEHNSVLFLNDAGDIGVGTTTPQYKLEVNGMAGMGGRVGTFASGKVKANGEWQTIVDQLEKTQAFELVAQAGAIEGRGRYAFTYAVALSNYGVGKIKHIKSTHRRVLGLLFDKISFRWAESNPEFNSETKKYEVRYKLQVKTAQNYGFLDDKGSKPAMIRYYVSKLWDSSMLPSEKADKGKDKVK